MEARKKHYVEDRGWCYEFNDIDDLTPFLKGHGFTLSPAGITNMARCLGLRPKELRERLEALGVPRPISTKDMVGRSSILRPGDVIVSFVRRARDGHGSPGTVFELRRPDGTTYADFVHSVNQNTRWWA